MNFNGEKNEQITFKQYWDVWLFIMENEAGCGDTSTQEAEQGQSQD